MKNNYLLIKRKILICTILMLSYLNLTNIVMSMNNLYVYSFQDSIPIKDLKSIVINKTYNEDTEIFPFEKDKTIAGINLSASIQLNGESSIVRVILVDIDKKEYMIYEAYPLIVNEKCGLENTNKMAEASTNKGHAGYVFKNGYKLNGYNDWYIPAKEELLSLKENMDYVGGFSRDEWGEVKYWSSTELSEDEAFGLNFIALSGTSCDKLTVKRIRPIRKF